MNLPKIFDKAKSPNYASGYERRFRRKECDKCSHFMKVDKYEGCSAKRYLIPMGGVTFDNCEDFKQG